VFSFASPICAFASVPIAASIGVGPAPIDFGDGDTLLRLASFAPKPFWVALLSVLGPTLALPAGIGWYHVLRQHGSYVMTGVLLWYIGMVLIVVQDSVEVALVDYLPSAYAAADATVRPSLLALGTLTGKSDALLALIGDLVSFFGLMFVNLALLRARGGRRFVGVVGLTSTCLIVTGLVVPLLSPQLESLTFLRGPGFTLFMLWNFSMGVILWKWEPAEADAVISVPAIS
jgi:hypothetical protein